MGRPESGLLRPTRGDHDQAHDNHAHDNHAHDSPVDEEHAHEREVMSRRETSFRT